MQKASDRADRGSACNPTYTWQEIPDDPPLPGHDSDEGVKKTAQQEKGLGMQESSRRKDQYKKKGQKGNPHSKAPSIYTLYSGLTKKAPREDNGEMLLWRGDFNFFYHIDQQHVSPEDATVIGDNDEVDVFMSQVASCLDIKRGHRLIRESEYRVLSKNQDWYVFRVPTPPPKLFIIYPNVTFGFQDHLEAQPREQYGDCICLKPVFHPKNSRPPEVPQYTALLAQHFINSVSMRWVEDQPLKLRMQVPSYDKLLLWVRMMLVNQEDYGHFIRPEVFTMAVEIAKGHRHAIGVASMAVLYRALDEVYYNIVTGTTSTTQGTRSLDFICYLHNNSREESQQLLQRRHLSFHRPKFTHFMSNLSHGGVVAHWIISSGAQKLLTSCEIQAHSGLAPEAQSRSGLHLTHMSKTTTDVDFSGRVSDTTCGIRCTMPPAQPASKLLDDDWMEILNKAVDPEATTRIQQLSSESKKLSMNVEHIITQVSQAVNMNCGAEENSLLKEYDGNNPVTLPKLSDVVSARGLKHVWSEIKAFQEFLKQRPVQKDVVLKEISINLDLWSNFFSKPPPKIIRLMEGLRVLKRALSGEARLPNTNLIPAQQDQINQYVDLLRTAQDKVESSCVALEALTSQYNVEQAV
ncbi:hypothetical protein OsI_22885 [Oryza sativa Indica Group]|uniref:Uncharacterized protein n=1 Tax=Oryza sativa subsp. indica TaxID=39946 RepID=B8B1P9_ORYSI|nr:hypothetical protein OsI_22885 [Oryza sativa Indica Group]